MQPAHDQLMDEKEFNKSMFQRPFQYLQKFNAGQELGNIRCKDVKGTPGECIEVLLRLVLHVFSTVGFMYSFVQLFQLNSRYYLLPVAEKY